ncbi:peptidylprolyl isomerase [Candidatus Omnitrophota bacterium]
MALAGIFPSVVCSEGLEDYLKTDVVGETFDQSVTREEFIYYFKTASLFTRTGKQERTEEETILEAWEDLIYRHETRDLNITASREELEEELNRLLSEKDIEYDTSEYRLWIKSQFSEDVETFERRIEDLVIINKLLKLKGDPEVSVTDEEMLQKFMNQYNSFESEYIKFENKEKAEEFLGKLKENPRLWKDTYDEKRPQGQEGASWINTMSMEALIDLWKIPKEDAYNIHSHNEGDFIVARFYYGDAVFRLLRKKEADMERYNDKKKEYYKNVLTRVKKQKLVKGYFEDLLKRANYKDYIQEKQLAAKKEELKKKSLIVLKTSSGEIELKLFPDVAPFACENFIGLVEKGYYDGLIFHRVIKDFMIQGGDPTGTGQGGESIWGDPFIDEVSDEVLFDRPGLLAMANSGSNTNKSQFFITVKETPHLNMKHTIFGEVVSGFEVVRKIENAPAKDNKPEEEQKIIKAFLKKDNPEGE